jgi:hypothetical protein
MPRRCPISRSHMMKRRVYNAATCSAKPTLYCPDANRGHASQGHNLMCHSATLPLPACNTNEKTSEEEYPQPRPPALPAPVLGFSSNQNTTKKPCCLSTLSCSPAKDRASHIYSPQLSRIGHQTHRLARKTPMGYTVIRSPICGNVDVPSRGFLKALPECYRGHQAE